MTAPIDRTSEVVQTGSFFGCDTPDGLDDWLHSLEYGKGARHDGYHLVDEGNLFGYVEPDPPALTRSRPPSTHRSGTCFEDESDAMRAACVPTIEAMLETDVVLHEVRHQQQGCHTDLVFADVDPDGLAARAGTVTGTEPLHDPLQRFKVWWHLVEYGPKSRSDAIENGEYADPSTNRKHVEWLLDHGYVARTETDYLVGVTPPRIADLHAVELKLRDWETALEQAARANRADVDDIYEQANPRLAARRRERYGYADYRWVALDAAAIDDALAHRDAFEEAGVGLLAVTEGGSVVKHVDAAFTPRGRYTRDRAWVESEVWAAVDLDAWVDRERDAAADDATADVTAHQPSLAHFDSGGSA